MSCAHFVQVESFIPLWEWDLPKKKKKRADKSEKGKAAMGAANGDDSLSPTPHIKEVVDWGDSRPASHQARVEEVPDEDS